MNRVPHEHDELAPQASRLEVSASRWKPGSTVTASLVPYESSRLMPTRGRMGALAGSLKAVALGTTVVASDGSFAASHVIPKSLAPGWYALRLEGTAPDGQPRSFDAAIDVTDRKAAQTVVLAPIRIGFKRLTTKLRPISVTRLVALASVIPDDATNVEVSVVSRYGTWDVDASRATKRAKKVVTRLRALGESAAAYAVAMEFVKHADLAKHRAMTLRVSYDTGPTR